MVEEDEGAHHAPLRGGEHPPDLEAAESVALRVEDEVEHALEGTAAWPPPGIGLPRRRGPGIGWLRGGSDDGASRALALLGLAAALGAPPAGAAPPLTPRVIPYQGVLLDDGGAPRTGPVDLTLRVYDAAAGGTLLYTQVLPAVPLTTACFSVTLGPTGSTSDVPVDPLTATLCRGALRRPRCDRARLASSRSPRTPQHRSRAPRS